MLDRALLALAEGFVNSTSPQGLLTLAIHGILVLGSNIDPILGGGTARGLKWMLR